MAVQLTAKEAKRIINPSNYDNQNNSGKANTSLSALNDMLFDQLERITNDDLDDQQIEKEIKRTKMITAVSEQIVNNAELELKAIKVREDILGGGVMPTVFGLPEHTE